MTTEKYDGNEILKDGEVLKVPMLLMDHQQVEISRHAAGMISVGDADRDERQQAVEARKQELSERWRSPSTQQAATPITRQRMLRLSTRSVSTG